MYDTTELDKLAKLIRQGKGTPEIEAAYRREEDTLAAWSRENIEPCKPSNCFRAGESVPEGAWATNSNPHQVAFAKSIHRRKRRLANR